MVTAVLDRARVAQLVTAHNTAQWRLKRATGPGILTIPPRIIRRSAPAPPQFRLRSPASGRASPWSFPIQNGLGVPAMASFGP